MHKRQIEGHQGAFCCSREECSKRCSLVHHECRQMRQGHSVMMRQGHSVRMRHDVCLMHQDHSVKMRHGVCLMRQDHSIMLGLLD
ncbi:hypothetical protein TanjilG_21041 [Lupinus angustifolius]|uniref:Uncharacterized protein n=1 Tax=Lupinus angustifolius TaxID=3871 RepID=A0A394DBJ8_LUPAN|nr:hypothetical protein TanjilG_21041 [Lupinus angustifolius]